MPDFIERIVVLDRRAFGQKVMEWANGAPIPGNLEEAEQQLTGIIQFPLPSYIKDMNFIKTTKDIWTIKIPPADMLQDTRNRIDANDPPYDIQPFYYDRVNGDLEDDHELFEFRVGDYTCSLCT